MHIGIFYFVLQDKAYGISIKQFITSWAMKLREWNTETDIEHFAKALS